MKLTENNTKKIPPALASSRSNNVDDYSLFIVAGLCIAWCFALQDRIFTEDIAGTDALLRLFYIDEIAPRKHWLPPFQLILQLVYQVSDTAIAYKLTCTVIALLSMVSVFNVTLKAFNVRVAVVTFAYFFYHYGWSVVATSAFSEPLMLLFVFVSLHFYQKHRLFWSIMFLTLACCTRFEALCFALSMGLFTFFESREYKKSIYIVCTGIPAVLYLVIYGLVSPTSFLHLSAPTKLSLNTSLQQFFYFFSTFARFPNSLFAALSIVGVVLSLRSDYFSKRQSRLILYLIGSLVIFYIYYCFITPLGHSFIPGGRDRKEIFTLLPVFFFLALFFEFCYHQMNRAMYCLLLLSIASTVLFYSDFVQYKNVKSRSDFSRQYVEWWPQNFRTKADMRASVNWVIEEGMAGKSGRAVFMCNPKNLINRKKPFRTRFDAHLYKRLRLYLRFEKYHLWLIHCTPEKVVEHLAGNKPLLRVYDEGFISGKDRENIVSSCTKWHTSKYTTGVPISQFCM